MGSLIKRKNLVAKVAGHVLRKTLLEDLDWEGVMEPVATKREEEEALAHRVDLRLVEVSHHQPLPRVEQQIQRRLKKTEWFHEASEW